MQRTKRVLGLVLLGMLSAFIAINAGAAVPAGRGPIAPVPARQPGDLVALGWNDLGMHCYNRDFQDLAVLPPYNDLVVQVVRVGDPPQIVTSGISVTYVFTDNTYSVGKSNFWDYDLSLFGVDLPPNVGLRGKGLAGEMDPHGTTFIAEGIPLTEFRDSAPTQPYPYMLSTVRVLDATTGAELAVNNPVAPVSTEMHCDTCHHDGGVGGISTGRVETNILTLHDEEHMNEYPPGHTGPLMNRRPILCAECHASNALGLPGVAGLPSLSNAMHDKHKEEVPQTTAGCYNCHPGPVTQCLRDVMSQQYGMGCINCHGTMEQVSNNPNPWLNEPRCDNAACHGSGYAQNQPLYRNSTGHGGVFCEACHDSPHAIAPSREPNDAIKFVNLQGHAGTLVECAVCHSVPPTAPGPHGVRNPNSVMLPVIGR